MDLVSIRLPDGYHQVDLQGLPAKMSRTMGCLHGSIKFVCIDHDHGVTPPGSKVVKVWTLDLDRREWNEDKSLTCPWEDFWTKACTMNTKFKHLQRPLHPQYPVLMPDGALCLLLLKTRHKPGVRVKKPDYICSFDMFSKSCLCFGHVHDYHVIGPVIFPSDFFKDCYPARRKRKPPTLEREPPMQASSGRICCSGCSTTTSASHDLCHPYLLNLCIAALRALIVCYN